MHRNGVSSIGEAHVEELQDISSCKLGRSAVWNDEIDLVPAIDERCRICGFEAGFKDSLSYQVGVVQTAQYSPCIPFAGTFLWMFALVYGELCVDFQSLNGAMDSSPQASALNMSLLFRLWKMKAGLRLWPSSTLDLYMMFSDSVKLIQSAGRKAILWAISILKESDS